MKPEETGKKYDRIAAWWNEHLQTSSYGIRQLELAIRYCTNTGTALDVGCGTGGRMVRKLQEHNFDITGIDVSSEMIGLARLNHPGLDFQVSGIMEFQPSKSFDLVFAWDSIFHLPLDQHADVINKMCSLLSPAGILMYTFGNATGEHTSEWHDDTFYYSSIGINANLQQLSHNGCTVMHLEIDQYPEKHVFVIARKDTNALI